MFVVVTETDDFQITKVSEHGTREGARHDIRQMIENGSENPFWVIDKVTGEIR